MTCNDLATEIRTIRKRKGITLKQMSERTGIDISHLSRFESGFSTIRLSTYIKICNALKLTITLL